MPPSRHKPVDIALLAAQRIAGFDLSTIGGKGPSISLEKLLTHHDGFGLRTATPLQLAICRIMEGTPLGDLDGHPDILEAFGANPRLNGIPKEVVVLSSIRSAKSLIAAARAVQMALTCDVSGLVAGEVPRTPVISVSRDLAQVAFGYICALAQNPLLNDFVLSPPGADSIMLRHPTGRPVEIKVTAGAKAGSSVVARWLAGVVFDEAPRMIGSEEGVINLDDTRSAAIGRILPNTSMLYVGSPWAPFGPVYEFFKKHFGGPTDNFVVAKAPGWIMNPYYWDKDRCAELQERDPAAYDTDCAANFADKVLAFLPSEAINEAIRSGVSSEPPQSEWEYVAAMDPATRENAWTFGIAGKSPTGKKRLVYATQWQGSASDPLKPRQVFEEMVYVLRQYRVSTVHTDQWSFDSLADSAKEHGVSLIQVSSSGQSKVNWYSSMRHELIEKTITLLDTPDLAQDLKRVQRKVTQRGQTIELPKTGDGRHCDYAAMLALLFSRYYPDPSSIYNARNTEESKIERTLLEENDSRDRWMNDL